MTSLGDTRRLTGLRDAVETYGDIDALNSAFGEATHDDTPLGSALIDDVMATDETYRIRKLRALLAHDDAGLYQLLADALDGRIRGLEPHVVAILWRAERGHIDPWNILSLRATTQIDSPATTLLTGMPGHLVAETARQIAEHHLDINDTALAVMASRDPRNSWILSLANGSPRRPPENYTWHDAACIGRFARDTKTARTAMRAADIYGPRASNNVGWGHFETHRTGHFDAALERCRQQSWDDITADIVRRADTGLIERWGRTATSGEIDGLVDAIARDKATISAIDALAIRTGDEQLANTIGHTIKGIARHAFYDPRPDVLYGLGAIVAPELTTPSAWIAFLALLDDAQNHTIASVARLAHAVGSREHPRPALDGDTP